MIAGTSRLASQLNRLPGEAFILVQVEEVEVALFSAARRVFATR
jgi:hypothetical protein